MTSPHKSPTHPAVAGPQPWAGKVRAAANAYRHGLAIPITCEPELTAEVEELAHSIAVQIGPKLLAPARPVAEAQLDVLRIRRVRRILLERLWSEQKLADLANAPLDIQEGRRTGQTRGDQDDFALDLKRTLQQLKKIERYEARAVSRRNRAMEIFDAVRVVEGYGCAVSQT
jgi:hypothetical protein